MKLQTEAAAVADELVARNQALSSAIRALTAEHAATCATSAAGREELSRLQHAYDVLDHQVSKMHMSCALNHVWDFLALFCHI